MLIRCPNCHFDREIDAARIPPNAVMATCPRCGERFRFRNSDGTPVLVEPDPAPSDPLLPTRPAGASPAQEPEARDAAGPGAASGAPGNAPAAAGVPEENPDDDPLPPGAVTIRPPEETAGRRPTPAPSGSGRAADTSKADGAPGALNAPGDKPEKTEMRPSRSSGQAAPEAAPPSFLDALRHAARKARDKGRPPSATPGPAGAGTRGEGAAGKMDIPWEHPERYGLLAGLYQTVLRVMFNAPRFFAGVGEATGSLVRPLVFYLLFGVFQTLVERMWFRMSIEASAPAITDPKVQEMLGAMAQSMSLPLTLLLSPVLVAVQLGLFAGLFFLMVRLVQPERASYPVLFRVIAYSAAPTVVCIVPLVGPPVGSLWFAVCCLVGCRHALSLTWARTLLALGPLYAIAFAIGLQGNIMLRQLLGG